MQVTEKKRIKIHDGCVDNPVYLRWVNRLGGYNYWLFGKRQSEDYKPTNKHVMTLSVGKVSTTLSTQEVIRKDVLKTIKIGAVSLDRNDIDGIMTMIWSVKVEMLTNISAYQSGAAPVWKTVIVEQNSVVIQDNSQSRFDIELEVIVDKYLTQSQ